MCASHSRQEGEGIATPKSVDTPSADYPEGDAAWSGRERCGWSSGRVCRLSLVLARRHFRCCQGLSDARRPSSPQPPSHGRRPTTLNKRRHRQHVGSQIFHGLRCEFSVPDYTFAPRAVTPCNPRKGVTCLPQKGGVGRFYNSEIGLNCRYVIDMKKKIAL